MSHDLQNMITNHTQRLHSPTHPTRSTSSSQLTLEWPTQDTLIAYGVESLIYLDWKAVATVDFIQDAYNLARTVRSFGYAILLWELGKIFGSNLESRWLKIKVITASKPCHKYSFLKILVDLQPFCQF